MESTEENRRKWKPSVLIKTTLREAGLCQDVCMQHALGPDRFRHVSRVGWVASSSPGVCLAGQMVSQTGSQKRRVEIRVI
jgi:hypothetical protein